MNTNIPTPLAFFMFLGTTLISCKKELKDFSLEEGRLQQEVVNWLNSNKVESQPNKASNIDRLIQSLNFSDAKVETFVDGDELIIIPINGRYKAQSSGADHSLLNLILINDPKNIIKNGRIAVFNPSKKELNSIPDHTFSKVLKLEPSGCDGSFAFLSVTGKLLHKYEYKNGSLLSFREVRSQGVATDTRSNSASNSNCTDWYIVTTYYLNGVPVSQDYVYIGTTCEGCDDPDLQTICPDNGGSGGGGGGTNDLIETTNVVETIEEDDETDALIGAAPKIRYQYNAQIVKTNGYVTSVLVHPTTISNAHEVYVDRFGRNTTRILTVFGHNNSWTSLGATAMIYWGCSVYGRWIYSNGTPEYNRTWTNTKTAIR